MSSTGNLADGLTRAGRAGFGAATELWTRGWEASARYARDALTGSTDADPSDGRVSGALRRYVAALAAVPGLALERLADGFDPLQPAPSEPAHRVGRHSIPIPARVRDATQGLAIFAVARDAAIDILAAQRAPFVPIDLGRGRTALAITGVRYRASDLGVYDEVGVAFLVAPASDPYAVGLYFVALPVNGRLSRQAGSAIWGYAKTEELIDVTLDGRRASWTLRRRRSRRRVLTISFPRGGQSTSSGVGLTTYTVRRGRPMRVQFVRSGRGERTLAGGGSVTLTLGSGARGRDPLLSTLHRLGLPGAPVLLHSWTERMSGALGPAQPLRPRVREARPRRPRRS